MLDKLKAILGVREPAKHPLDLNGYLDTIMDCRFQLGAAKWIEKQRQDSSCRETNTGLLDVYARNFGQMAPGLREAYAALPIEDLRRLAESYLASMPELARPQKMTQEELSNTPQPTAFEQFKEEVAKKENDRSLEQGNHHRDHDLER